MKKNIQRVDSLQSENKKEMDLKSNKNFNQEISINMTIDQDLRSKEFLEFDEIEKSEDDKGIFRMVAENFFPEIWPFTKVI